MSIFFKAGNTVTVTPLPNNSKPETRLPTNTYIVKFNAFTSTFFLEEITEFKNDVKIYGNCKNNSDRIFNTFLERKGKNTGVLLSGEKGSGKTLLLKILAEKSINNNIPVVIVNENFSQNSNIFNKFISDIDHECMIIFDEFEKVYSLNEQQESILTLLDGVYNSNKLFAFTVNKLYNVNEFFLNRPGRIFYHIKFSGIDESFIEQYCNDNLNNKNFIIQMKNLGKILGKSFNFDMLKAITEECNRYNEEPKKVIDIINITFDTNEYLKYNCKISYNGKKYETISGNINIFTNFTLWFEDNDDDFEIEVNNSYLNKVVDGKYYFNFQDKNNDVSLVMERMESKTFYMDL